MHHNHRRPARLAASSSRVLRADGPDLHVAGLDADDGTLVVDLVAVCKEAFLRGSVTRPVSPAEMLKDCWSSAVER
ncbi:hypothetical protein [Streptomyces sp. AS58]|uniref:hypothetical protein n=1 Tax=Streptomyces sp. AS58 TaxID=1519489 RepID=UPI0006B055B6|nr:hypothetical protein [Streptomyces sp. AS58]